MVSLPISWPSTCCTATGATSPLDRFVIDAPGWRTSGHDLVFPVRRLVRNGREACAQVVERGYEGYVAKDETSVYEGGRTRRWRKVKQKEWMVAEDGWRRRISVPQPAP